VPGPSSGFHSSLATLGDTYFFTARSAEGVELWKSDGTAAGTVLVKDINPGPMSSQPHDAFAFGGVLWFSALDAEHGEELWRTDGTTVGTVLVSDFEPGVMSSSPSALSAGARGLLLNAHSSARGREAWFVGPLANISITAEASTPSPLIGATFSVVITVSNAGPAAADDVVLDYTVPAGFTIIAATPSAGSCDLTPVSNAVLQCALGDVGADGSVTITLSATASAAGLASTTAAVTAASFDVSDDDRSAVLSVNATAAPLVPAADLAVSASVTPSTVTIGGQATVAVTITNNGPDAATSVTVMQTVSGAAVTSAQGIGTIGTLASGASVSATIVVSPSAAGTVSAVVSVSAAEADATMGNNSASVTLTAVAAAANVDDVDDVNVDEQPTDEASTPRPGCACKQSAGVDDLVLAAAVTLLLLRRRRK